MDSFRNRPIPRTREVKKAYAWISGTLISYTFVAVATRETTFELDTPTILFFRSIVAVLLTTALVGLSARGFQQIRTQRFGLHVIRNCIHFVGQFGWFFAIATIPLAHVFALEFTVPIWIALLAPIFLKEKLTWDRMLYILIGFAGVIIIVQPFGLDVELGAIVMLIGALGFAGGMLGTRKLTLTETPLCILFYMAVVQLPMSTTLMLTTGTYKTPSLITLLLIVFITAGVMTAHYCMARAFELMELISIVPVEYIRLPLIAVAGLLIYAEPIDVATIIGSAAILAGNYLNIRKSAQEGRN